MIVAEGPTATRELLQDILGCIFAWSLIDAMNFVMNRMFERSRSARLIEAVQIAPNDEQGLAIIQNELEPDLEAFSSKEERTSLYRDVFRTVKAVAVPKTRIEMEEIGGAASHLPAGDAHDRASTRALPLHWRSICCTARIERSFAWDAVSRRLFLGPRGENEPVVDGPGRHVDRCRHGGCRQDLRRLMSIRGLPCLSHVHLLFRLVFLNTRLPRPTSFDLNTQRPAQKGADKHEQTEDCDIVQGWLQCHGANYVPRNEKFQTQQQGLAN